MTQVDIIRKQLLSGNSLTQRSALMDFGIMALPRRITDLRETGFPVKVEMKTNPMTGQRFAQYSMDDIVTDPSKLVPGCVYKLVDVVRHPFSPGLVERAQGYVNVVAVGPVITDFRIAGQGQIAGHTWMNRGDFKLKYIGGMA